MNAIEQVEKILDRDLSWLKEESEDHDPDDEFQDFPAPKETVSSILQYIIDAHGFDPWVQAWDHCHILWYLEEVTGVPMRIGTCVIYQGKDWCVGVAEAGTKMVVCGTVMGKLLHDYNKQTFTWIPTGHMVDCMNHLNEFLVQQNLSRIESIIEGAIENQQTENSYLRRELMSLCKP